MQFLGASRNAAIGFPENQGRSCQMPLCKLRNISSKYEGAAKEKSRKLKGLYLQI